MNRQRPSRATGVIPAVRLAEEAGRLRPLRVTPEDLALRIPVVVGPTGYVVHDTHPYSMPPEAIGIPGTLYLGRTKVRIVCGRYEAVHDRQSERGKASTLPEHRARRVAAVSGTRAKRYLKREHLIQLGGSALVYITEIVHRRPRVWIRDVDRLHEYLERHGDPALRAEGLYGHEYIAHFLREGGTPPVPPATQMELGL